MAINLTKTLTALELAASMGLTAVSGTADLTLAPLEFEGSISFDITATLTLAPITLTASADCTSFGGTFTLLPLELEASAYASSGSLSKDLGALQLRAYAGRVYGGSLSKTLSGLELSATASIVPDITLSKTLSALQLVATIRPSTLCLAVNVSNQAVSEYSFSHESIASKDGTVYMSDGTKIYTLSGDDDDGTDIDSIVQLGLMDAGSNRLKRLTDLFFTLRSDGTMEVYVVDDETVSSTALTLESTSDVIKTVYVRPGLNNQSAYYSLKFNNVSSSDFEIAKIIAIGKLLPRRHHA